ncbi:EAL domain protein, partial [Vibrio parahaemolyticus V-223/04]
QNRTG